MHGQGSRPERPGTAISVAVQERAEKERAAYQASGKAVSKPAWVGFFFLPVAPGRWAAIALDC